MHAWRYLYIHSNCICMCMHIHPKYACYACMHACTYMHARTLKAPNIKAYTHTLNCMHADACMQYSIHSKYACIHSCTISRPEAHPKP